MVHNPQWVNQCSLLLTADPLTFQFVIRTVQNPQSTPNKQQNCLRSGKTTTRCVERNRRKEREREREKQKQGERSGGEGRKGEEERRTEPNHPILPAFGLRGLVTAQAGGSAQGQEREHGG